MHYVIIGGSAAGVSCVEGIRKTDKKSGITLIGDETLPLYSRCLLSYLLAGTISEGSLFFKKKDFFKAHKVEALLGARAQGLDLKNRSVQTSDKKKIEFDRLLLATGSMSRTLDIPGVEKHGVFALRNIKDAKGIESSLKKTRTAVILGGGLIGLRAAYALNARGIIVKIVVKSRQILSQVLDQTAAEIIQRRIEEKGIAIIKGSEAKEIFGKTGVEGVTLDDGSDLGCELVIIGKGVEPNKGLAHEAGIGTDQGILADDNLMTSSKDIFAAGDVAQTGDITSGESVLNAIWPVAVEQGKIAGMNMAGAKRKYDGSMAMNSIEFFGLPTISMGITRPKTADYEQLTAVNGARPVYKKVVLKDGVIRGFISVGKIENSGVYNALIKHRVDVTAIKDGLLREDFDYAKAMPLIKENKDRFSEEEFRDSIITY
ncbi:MAG: NAD(P)/FAD-dependent oxidoreductase [Candidatus Omnitrophica bacterium]|nr:NAD(P)/FAD-dependent oxidoreductase [Candidatus Omnitrophota bacterium]